MNGFRVRAPGRICLFGEHQDYLGYPIIAAAINRYITIECSFEQNGVKNAGNIENFETADAAKITEAAKIAGVTKITDAAKITDVAENFGSFHIVLPDINRSIDFEFKPDEELQYQSNRDYIRSCFNILHRKGFTWDNLHYNLKITGNIPINAGASSSSALVIGCIKAFSQLANKDLDVKTIAELGYYAEVEEFGEAGGMMDHFASAFGGILFMETAPEFKPSKLKIPSKRFSDSFILVNSRQKKQTVDDLRKVKNKALNSIKDIKEAYPNFNKYTSTLEEIEPYLESIAYNKRKVLVGNIINRDLTLKGKKLLKSISSDFPADKQKEFGNLLSEHHKNLSENIGVSTKKIDYLLEVSKEMGALGGKINGSGFGGTFFIYCPKSMESVISVLETEKVDIYKIQLSEGVSMELSG